LSNGGKSVAVSERSSYSLLKSLTSDARRLDEGSRKRQRLIRTWQRRIDHLQVGFSRTDILRALFLADQLFHERPSGERNRLVIFSDMRQDTADLNLETDKTFDAGAALGRTQKKGLIAGLGNVEVYILGVDNAGKSIAYWNRLREYWLEYFKKAEADVQSYTVLRELRDIEP
jgi:hypothetical protein